MKYLIWINSEQEPNIGSVAKNESSNIVIINDTVSRKFRKKVVFNRRDLNGNKLHRPILNFEKFESSI